MTIQTFFRKEVLELPAYHVPPQDGIKLNQNESPWDIPAPLKALVVENLLKTPWNRYPLEDPLLLKKKLAKALGLWADNLVFANGSNVLIQALIVATSIENRVMVVDPTFSVYELEAKLLGNKVTRFPLEPDFSLNFDNFFKTMRKDRPKIIFIPNPNAPTGNLFPAETLRKVIESFGGLVVVDEAYYPFSGSTIIDWVKQYDNLVVLRTFSKAFALGGLRLGYLAADPEVAGQIEKCLLPFRVSRLVHVTAMTLLDHPEFVDDYVKAIITERNRLAADMAAIAGVTVHPSHTNFILFEVEDSTKTFEDLLAKKIIVRQVNDGRRLTNALRVSVGTKEENDAFLAALKKVV